MIIGWFLLLFAGSVTTINNANNAHASDFDFSQNQNILAVISYMMQANHFFPIDQYLIIAGLYFLIYGAAAAVKALEVATNVIRGAGLRL